MIWSCQAEELTAAEDLAATIAADLAAVVTLPPLALAETAAAVAAFIRDQHPNEALSATYRLVLIARALWAIGEEQQARRFIAARGAAWQAPPLLADMAVAREISLPHWRALLDSRTVRPTASLARGAIWIVDLQCLRAAASTGLELTLFRTIKAMVDHLASVWDHTQGRGILGLRHLQAAAAELLNCFPRSRSSRVMAEEIKNQFQARLQAARICRAWQALPEIICLDMQGS